MSEPRYKFNYPDVGIEWVRIPAGTFFMGLTEDQVSRFKKEGKGQIPRLEQHIEWESPGQERDIGTFYISRYPITNQQFRKFVHTRHPDRYRDLPEGYTWGKRYNEPEFNRYPVICKWWAAHEFSAWVGGRLPTSMEWEKAARGTDARLYPWGNDWDVNRGNFGQRDRRGRGSVGLDSPVDIYPEGASPYGVIDMMGNGYEWTMTFDTIGFRVYGSQMPVLRGSTPKHPNLHPWAHRVTHLWGTADPWDDPNFTTFRPVMDEIRWEAIFRGGLEAERML